MESSFQVCDKRQILKEKMTEYIHREKDILRHITEKWDTKFPYFVRLYATFSVSILLKFLMGSKNVKFLTGSRSAVFRVNLCQEPRLFQIHSQAHRQRHRLHSILRSRTGSRSRLLTQPRHYSS